MVLKHEAETEGLSRETELKQRVLPGSWTKNAKTLARGPLSSLNLTWAENLIHLKLIKSDHWDMASADPAPVPSMKCSLA